MPAIAREQAFFSTLFGLDVGKDPRAKEAVERYFHCHTSILGHDYYYLICYILPPVLSTCPLHTNSGCERREAHIHWFMVTCQGSTRLELP